MKWLALPHGQPGSAGSILQKLLSRSAPQVWVLKVVVSVTTTAYSALCFLKSLVLIGLIPFPLTPKRAQLSASGFSEPPFTKQQLGQQKSRASGQISRERHWCSVTVFMCVCVGGDAFLSLQMGQKF